MAIAAFAGIILISVFVFFSASAAAYACSVEWSPTPTASPAAGASAKPGYVQPDMGQTHVQVGVKVTYTYCPPASGPHYNASGLGPIQPRLYGPNDRVIPEGWIHNLEHGALVILYRGDGPGATEAGQQALQTMLAGFPNSPVCNTAPSVAPGVVIARFDDMATPYAALVWGRVLPLQELDTTAIVDFWRIWGERTNPEKLPCQVATPSPSAEASPATSPEAGPAVSPASAEPSPS